MALHTIILAAGIGKRMKSKQVKVLHDLMGKPIIEWVIDQAKSISKESITIVYGKKGKKLKDKFPGIQYALQEEPTGTGAAVAVALKKIKEKKGTVVILSGDIPLIRKKSLAKLLDFHKKNALDVTIMTFCPKDPEGYGRIIRSQNEITKIIEERDASKQQKKIGEVNGGIYVFSIYHLRNAIKKLNTDNAQGEYYLTDVVAIIRENGGKIGGFKTENPLELKGINTRKNLSEAIQILRDRKIESLQKEGVTIMLPETVYIEPNVKVGQDTIIYPNTVLLGNTIIGSDCILEPFVYLIDKKIPSGTTIKSG
jgi:bifunctional UDP-N-acetylglucosamine pyrophosphorylase/glucosamine-1-phosphate N-acetyltransferase